MSLSIAEFVNEIHPFSKDLRMCVYVYNTYVLVFRMPNGEWKFGSMCSVMNGFKLSLEVCSPCLFTTEKVSGHITKV